MANPSPSRMAYPALAAMLDHPWPGAVERWAQARHTVAEHCPEASRAVEEFLEATRQTPLDALQEGHMRLFTLLPRCNLYVGAQLVGDESSQRAQFMAGLARRYEEAGFDWRPELPDHLCSILRFAPRFEEQEWTDMVGLCLRPTVGRMAASLDGEHGGPYRFLLLAIGEALAQELGQEESDG